MYREIDEKIINKNLGKLEDKAKEIYLNNYEPKLTELNEVYKIIKDYIKEKDLIIYGGYAQNALIKIHEKKKVFYKEIDVPDIEFYTHEPQKDLIQLCDILNEKKFKFVEGVEGVHNETYNLFVNFHGYLDISYMPKNILDNCPTIRTEGMRMTHPHFMFVDALRVYTDPMTSYFRLSKTFSRFTTLMDYFPFNEEAIYNIIHFNVTISEKEYDKITKFIRKQIIRNSKLIMIGFHPFNRLMKKAEMPKTHYIQEYYYQVISDNYNNDKDKILNLLNKNFKNITKKSYYKFFQFCDKSTEYYYKDQLILRLYGNNGRCNVHKYSNKKKIHYGTFQLILMYCLIHYNIAIIRNNKFIQKVNITMMTRLLKARDTYLEKRNLNVLDKTPFEEFTMECIGKPYDILRESRIKLKENIKKGKKAKFRYTPKGTPGKVPNYIFENSSGDVKN